VKEQLAHRLSQYPSMRGFADTEPLSAPHHSIAVG
jgi:hypothetical protein